MLHNTSFNLDISILNDISSALSNRNYLTSLRPSVKPERKKNALCKQDRKKKSFLLSPCKRKIITQGICKVLGINYR